MTVVRTANIPDRAVMDWVGRLAMMLQSRYMQFHGGKRALHENPKARGLILAGALLTVEPDAESAFKAVYALLLSSRPTKKKNSAVWEQGMSAIPVGRLGAVAAVVRVYEAMAARGHFRSLTSSGTRVADLRALVEGMLAVSSSPDAYLEVVSREWFDHPTQVFAETTRARVAPKLRGMLGDLQYTDVKRPVSRVD